jgi:hypothetical protein
MLGVVFAVLAVWLSLPSAAVGLCALLPARFLEALQPCMNQTGFSNWLGLAMFFVAFVGIPVALLTLLLNIPALAIRELPIWLKVVSSCFIIFGLLGVWFVRFHLPNKRSQWGSPSSIQANIWQKSNSGSEIYRGLPALRM